MIQITQEKWDSISWAFKGIFSREDAPELIGRKTVMSGAIGSELHSLLIEGIHFEVIKESKCLK